MKVPGRRWRNTLYLVVGVAIASPAWAVEPRWPEGPYNYLVLDQDIRGVLEQFGRNVNLPVRVGNDVEPHRVRGKIGGPSAKAFLQWVCDAYQLVWYFDGATLHILPQSALQSVYLDLSALPLEALKQHLIKSGLLEERFPLMPTADPAMASVAGPPPYTLLVKQVLTSLKSEGQASRQADGAGGTRSTTNAEPAISSPQQNPADQPRAPAVITGIERAPSPAASAAETSAPASAASPKSDQQLSTTIEKSPRPNEATDDAEAEGKGKVLVFRGG